jgi:hypothetical protein
VTANPITQTTVPCPGCGLSLVALSDAGGTFGGCLACGGLFLDNVACKQLMDATLSQVEFGRMITTKASGAAPSTAPYRSAGGRHTCSASATALGTS